MSRIARVALALLAPLAASLAACTQQQMVTTAATVPEVLTWEIIPVPQGAGLPTTFGVRSFDAVQSPSRTEATILGLLADTMAGSYDTREQSLADPEYFDIRLHMARIWPERTDAAWLYVEQAMSTAQQKPYRQRVYKLTATDARTLVSSVYELPGDPLRFTGAWKDRSKLDGITPEQLVAREGCEITLTYTDSGTFTGSTRPRACGSTLRGATYATSEVIITPNQLISWDRGFDAEDKQVWGAVKGGYIFRKQSAQ